MCNRCKCIEIHCKCFECNYEGGIDDFSLNTYWNLSKSGEKIGTEEILIGCPNCGNELWLRV
jgi:hypothetical protein